MLDLGEEVLRMPWREVTRVSLRKEFVLLAMPAGSNRRELCRRFGIAPKTGYKWLARDAQGGGGGRPNTAPGGPGAVPRALLLKSNRRWSGSGTSRATHGAGASGRVCSHAKGDRRWRRAP